MIRIASASAMLFWVTVSSATSWAAEPQATAPVSQHVPAVSCPSDGQIGPQPGPKDLRSTPMLPSSAALQLAYYNSDDLAVLAPRGWHCFGMYGSNGYILIVSPTPVNAENILLHDGTLPGPAVQLAYRDSETSGRFEVAEVAARLFPTKRAFVERVIAEGIEPAADFPFGPYPDDILTRRSATNVEFETPANQNGMGTASRLVKSADPIDGLAILTSGDDLVLLDVRLPAPLRPLTRTILDNVQERLSHR